MFFILLELLYFQRPNMVRMLQLQMLQTCYLKVGLTWGTWELEARRQDFSKYTVKK